MGCRRDMAGEPRKLEPPAMFLSIFFHDTIAFRVTPSVANDANPLGPPILRSAHKMQSKEQPMRSHESTICRNSHQNSLGFSRVERRNT